MKAGLFIILSVCLTVTRIYGQEPFSGEVSGEREESRRERLPGEWRKQGAGDTLRLTLHEAIRTARLQSVDAAVALNELKTSYWRYRTYRAERLPEITFTGTVPAYNKNYSPYHKEDGTYTFIRNNYLNMSGEFSVSQNIPFTGGRVSVNTSLDFTRQLGAGAENKFMSIPFSVTLKQPLFGVNARRWDKKIEPVKYQEAKARYIEQTEEVTLSAIEYFFNLILAGENVKIARQNLENARKLAELARAKRKIGQISESDLMQLELSQIQAEGRLTEAQSGFNASMFRLRAFLGLNEGETIVPVVPQEAPLMRLEYAAVLERAQENNSFAKKILRQQLEADYAVAAARGNRREINLYASYGYSGVHKRFRESYRGLVDNQIVEVGMTIPILDWGKRKGKVKVEESNREVIRSRIRQEQLNFNQNIFLLVENFNNQAGQLSIAQQADGIARKRYRAAIETFMVGKISVLDLNDARDTKDAAMRKLIEEMYLYWKYYYNVRSVTLYDFRNHCDLETDFEEVVYQ